MQNALTKSQILDVLAAEPAAKTASVADLERLVRRVEWEHKIGDDPIGFTKQKMVRRKEEKLRERLENRMPNKKKWNSESLANLLASHRDGEAASAIAGRLGLTRQRVYDLIRTAEREEARPKEDQECPFDGLSVRARNALLAASSERTLDAAYQLLASGKRITNIGAGSRFEIRQFLIDKGYTFHGQ